MTGREGLSAWVREHEVTWELGPWQEMSDHRPEAVGFELRLFARHGPDAQPSPGCGKCAELYARLRELALEAFPRDERPTRYEIEPFDTSFHLRPESAWTPEVQLAVHIIHRERYLRPVDDCEKRCAAEIQANLTRLGVQPQRWSQARAREEARREGMDGK